MKKDMESLLRPDGTMRQSRFVHALRTAAYFMFGTAGALLLTSPLLDDVYGSVGYAMGIFMAVGGFFCGLGSVTHRWAGEFSGIPLLSTSFLVFGLLVFSGSYKAAPFLAMSNLLLLAGVSTLLSVRWRTVYEIYRIARIKKPRRD